MGKGEASCGPDGDMLASLHLDAIRGGPNGTTEAMD
jgi:hypothetical protein